MSELISTLAEVFRVTRMGIISHVRLDDETVINRNRLHHLSNVEFDPQIQAGDQVRIELDGNEPEYSDAPILHGGFERYLINATSVRIRKAE